MNSSYYSDNKSVRTTGGGLANRLTNALSCVARNLKNGVGLDSLTAQKEELTEEEKKSLEVGTGYQEQPEGDEEVADLEQLIEEFNAISDLTVKLNSQVKISKIIEINDDN